MEKSVYRSVTIASLIMMVSVFLSRVIGLFREMVIAGVGGTRAAVDAYQVAFVVPEILNHLVASGFLSVTFIPIFSHYLVRRQEALAQVRDPDAALTQALVADQALVAVQVLVQPAPVTRPLLRRRPARWRPILRQSWTRI